MGNKKSTPCKLITAEELSSMAKERIKEEMQELAKIKPPDPISMEQLIKNSNKFPIEFPVQTARVASQVSFCF